MKARGQGRIYVRGGKFWIQYYCRGQLFRESSESSIRRVAGDLLKRRLGEMGKGEFVGPAIEKTTFEDMAVMIVNDYKLNGRRSLDRVELSIRHLRGTFGRMRAIDITHDKLLAYLTARLEHAKPATVKLDLAALRRMFKLARKSGKVTHRPEFPTVTVHNARTGFFEQAELQAVLAELPEDVRPLVEFLSFTGWRVSEGMSLRWSQVDQLGGVIRLEVGSTKSRAGRVFPFAAFPALASLIAAQRERTSALERERDCLCPWVFHREGRPILSFNVTWRRACARAGVAGRLVHDLRRSAARNLVRSGVPEHTAMALLGHKTRSIFDRYCIVDESDLAEGVRKLAAFSSAAPIEPRRVVPITGSLDSRTSTVRAQYADEERDA